MVAFVHAPLTDVRLYVLISSTGIVLTQNVESLHIVVSIHIIIVLFVLIALELLAEFALRCLTLP